MPVRVKRFKLSRKNKLKLRALAKRFAVSVAIEKDDSENVFVTVMKIFQPDYVMNFQINDRSSLYEEIEVKINELVICYRIKLPIVLFDELNKHFKQNYSLIASWIGKPKAPLEGKRPIDVLKEEDGLNKVMSMLERMKTGDFS
ncbi:MULTISPECIES: MbcA/ParS/Xre antitoxin family protein [unclassified Shewanella]|uniref:MbcA/ParS/Xre antitoxin family protein n=1 Tax=unclassified Shewanella TaxID=196818 RepID=UPI0035502809